MRVVVTGASGGIGQAFVRQLLEWPQVRSVQATYRSARPDIADARLHWRPLDLTDEAAIARRVAGTNGRLEARLHVFGVGYDSIGDVE